MSPPPHCLAAAVLVISVNASCIDQRRLRVTTCFPPTQVSVELPLPRRVANARLSICPCPLSVSRSDSLPPDSSLAHTRRITHATSVTRSYARSLNAGLCILSWLCYSPWNNARNSCMLAVTVTYIRTYSTSDISPLPARGSAACNTCLAVDAPIPRPQSHQSSFRCMQGHSHC